MTHEKYNELQKKIDKVYSDFVNELAEIETEEDINKVSEWVGHQIKPIIEWAKDNDAEEKILDDVRRAYFKLQEVLHVK